MLSPTRLEFRAESYVGQNACTEPLTALGPRLSSGALCTYPPTLTVSPRSGIVSLRIRWSTRSVHASPSSESTTPVPTLP